MWIPKFQYPVTSGTLLTLTRSMRHWSRRNPLIGGRREAAAGPPNVAAFTIRRDRLLQIVVPFDELTEYAGVEAFVEWAQDNPATAFTFWPDKAVAGTSYAVYMVSPVHGEEFAPPRSEFPSDLEVAITLRRSNGATWPLAYYPD